MVNLVQERALYRHFKSTPDDPKLYITLRVYSANDGYNYVDYCRLGDLSTVHTREEEEFAEVITRDNRTIARFALVMSAIITVEEAKELITV